MINWYIFWGLVIVIMIGMAFLLAQLDYYARLKREHPPKEPKGKKK